MKAAAPLSAGPLAIALAFFGYTLNAVPVNANPVLVSRQQKQQTYPNVTANDIAFIVASTGIVPAALAGAAGSLIYGILQQTEAQLDAAFAGCSSEKCTSPELYYSYGKSPPVYPSPKGSGIGDWSEAYSKARSLASQLTDAEKESMVTPASSFNGCSGLSGGVSRLGFTGICMNDNGNNVHLPGANITGFTSGISVAASWNRNLTYQRAVALGKEFRGMGINMALGPVVGPLGRMAKNGRNWEGLSNDPYLAGQLVSQTISGMQENVIACVKHFVAYEQETQRVPFLNGLLAPLGLLVNESVSSNLDDRTMHELYLWPFQDAVRAGAGAVMSSYQRVNGSHASQNSKILNGLLKTELGFQGFVVSDFYGQHTGVAAANAGSDMVMPDGFYWNNGTLVQANKNGSLETGRLNDMATRILASWYRFAQLEENGVSANINNNVRTAESHEAAYQSAVEGHVLVKNANSTLPLTPGTALNVFGYDAVSGVNTSVSELYNFGLANTQQYLDGSSFSIINVLELVSEIAPPGTPIPAVALNGTLIAGGGSGAVNPPIEISPYDALSGNASQINLDGSSQNPSIQYANSPCLVFINAQATEAADRSTLNDEYSNTLIENVASQCANTIVVIHNAGIRVPGSWADNTNVTAIVFAHTPGENSGNSLVGLLYGKQSFSGRLPYTIAYNESDYGPLLNPTLPTSEHPQYAQSDFSEGVHIDYRYFIQQNITPRYAFGYGLTYSQFEYSDISVAKSSNSTLKASPPDAGSTPPEGGLDSLFETLVTVTAIVKNTGNALAKEVAQLYIGIPNTEVPKALRGFDKVSIQPGSSAQVTFDLRRRDLSMWDVVSQQWVLQQGDYRFMVGKSVLDIQLNMTMQLL